MCAYGGPQGGWQDPYGQQQPYGQPQYGQQPQYGMPQYGYGPPSMPNPPQSNGAAIGALVCNILAVIGVFFCCLLGAVAAIPGIILAGLAIGRTQTNPESARQLTLWSWVCFGLAILISVGLFVIFLAIGFSAPATPNY